MHFNLDNAVAATGFTASALNVEAESSLFIAFRFCIRSRCEQIADHIKYACIGRRIGTGRPPNRRLVDRNDLIQLLDAVDARMFSRNTSRTV